MKPFDNIHMLIVDGNRESLTRLCALAQSGGAYVHAASSRTEGLSLFFRLFVDGVSPRILLTDWYLLNPRGDQARYYDRLGRHDDYTALNLIRRVKRVDPRIKAIVHTGWLEDVEPNVADYTIGSGHPINEVHKLLVKAVGCPDGVLA